MKRFIIISRYAKEKWKRDNPGLSTTTKSNLRSYFLDGYYDHLYASLPLWRNVSR